MIWEINDINSREDIVELSKQLNVSSTIASLLVSRGVRTYDEAKLFFRPSLDDLHDPFLMKDMDKAVNRILSAIDSNENILIYGDYDVDGTTSVALVSKFLKNNVTNNIQTYIPDRYNEGYGISYKSIDYAFENNFSLIIALDCGIKAIDKVSYANEKNIDFIICDHHKPDLQIPQAIAILNPLRNDCEYPFKYLCGCGIGYKLIQGLNLQKKTWNEAPENYLDLVAIAIGADLVPLNGENRVLCYHGLQVINKNPRAGIKAILRGIKNKSITLNEVSFQIAPRINAAGRIKHGNNAVELLIEEDFDKAIKFSNEIDIFNNQRREIDKTITSQALIQIEKNKEKSNFSTVVFQEDWHKGVIGIVASRLIEKYYRPTLVFTKSNDCYAASARSVKGFDIYNAIESCKDYLIQYGGHKYAAGLTLKPDNFLKFKNAFEKIVKNSIDSKLMTPSIQVDEKIKLSTITPKFYRILKQFAPFGPSNKKPVFLSENLIDTGFCKTVGEENNHLKCIVTQKGYKFSSIGFGIGEKIGLIKNKTPFNAVYNIEENYWNGKTSMQLKLIDLNCEPND
jgi:single-stranded-DNA-specific exonuclease